MLKINCSTLHYIADPRQLPTWPFCATRQSGQSQWKWGRTSWRALWCSRGSLLCTSRPLGLLLPWELLCASCSRDTWLSSSWSGRTGQLRSWRQLSPPCFRRKLPLYILSAPCSLSPVHSLSCISYSRMRLLPWQSFWLRSRVWWWSCKSCPSLAFRIRLILLLWQLHLRSSQRWERVRGRWVLRSASFWRFYLKIMLFFKIKEILN